MNFLKGYHKFIIKATQRILGILLPSPLQYYLEDDSSYFYENYKDPLFDDKPYRNKLNPYFLKYGIKEPLVEAEYYSRSSGVKSDRYMSRGMAFKLVYSYLERVEFLPAYSDKNIQKKILSLDKIGKSIDIAMPGNIIYNMNGCYFDSQDQEISREEAISILNQTQRDIILKPAIGSCGGKNVIKVSFDKTSNRDFEGLIKKYHSDFVFQEVICQHPSLKAFNPSSVNTIRIVTFRNSKKERRVLFALVRFGGEGSIMDNICSGGGFCMIELETGKLKDRKKYQYPQINPNPIPDSLPNNIPYFEKIKEAALTMHGQLPHFDVIGWDITVDPEGHLVLVEFNVRPGHGLQQGTGPMFTDEEFDEIMKHASKLKQKYEVKGFLAFPDKPGFYFKN